MEHLSKRRKKDTSKYGEQVLINLLDSIHAYDNKNKHWAKYHSRFLNLNEEITLRFMISKDIKTYYTNKNYVAIIKTEFKLSESHKVSSIPPYINIIIDIYDKVVNACLYGKIFHPERVIGIIDNRHICSGYIWLNMIEFTNLQWIKCAESYGLTNLSSDVKKITCTKFPRFYSHRIDENGINYHNEITDQADKYNKLIENEHL